MLHSIDWQLVTSISRQPTGFCLRSSSSQEVILLGCFVLKLKPPVIVWDAGNCKLSSA